MCVRVNSFSLVACLSECVRVLVYVYGCSNRSSISISTHTHESEFTRKIEPSTIDASVKAIQRSGVCCMHMYACVYVLWLWVCVWNNRRFFRLKHQKPMVLYMCVCMCGWNRYKATNLTYSVFLRRNKIHTHSTKSRHTNFKKRITERNEEASFSQRFSLPLHISCTLEHSKRNLLESTLHTFGRWFVYNLLLSYVCMRVCLCSRCYCFNFFSSYVSFFSLSIFTLRSFVRKVNNFSQVI